MFLWLTFVLFKKLCVLLFHDLADKRHCFVHAIICFRTLFTSSVSVRQSFEQSILFLFDCVNDLQVPVVFFFELVNELARFYKVLQLESLITAICHFSLEVVKHLVL